MCMGSVCCFDYVLNGRRLWYDKIDHFPCICGQIRSTVSWMREEFKPLNRARWFNSRLSWLLSFLLYVWCVWWRSTASWMREEGFSQAQGRTVITCTIDTTTLIMWMCQSAAFGGRINLFSPTITAWVQYEVIEKAEKRRRIEELKNLNLNLHAKRSPASAKYRYLSPTAFISSWSDHNWLQAYGFLWGNLP